MTQEFVTLPREAVERAIEALFCTDSEEGSAAYENELEAVKKLRAALKQPQNYALDAGNMVPAGWKLVPVEPTDDMLYDIQEFSHILPPRGKRIWAHMLAAAPQPPALDQPQANQPAMAPIAQRKLDSLLTEGYTISGYSVYHERKHQHGFVTGAGLVGWWKPECMEYPQPRGEHEPVGEAGSMPGTDGFTMACFRASDVPVGTKLYTRQHHRQPLNDDEILHTGIPEQLWFAKRFGSAPAGWTDEQIRTHNFFQSAVTQLVRAIERAHGIK